MRFKRIILILVIICLALMNIIPVFATPELIRKVTSLPGLDRIQFLAINGSDQFYTYEIDTLDFEEKKLISYSLENPFSSEGYIYSEANFPAYLDKDKVYALLTIKERASSRYVGEQIGMTLIEEAYIAATQVAIWIAVSEKSQQYKIVESSIKNEAVLQAAKWMLSIAAEYISRKTYNMDIITSIWPTATLVIDNSAAKGNVHGLFNYYGPYYIDSVDTSLDIYCISAIDNFAITDAVGGSTIKSVRVKQPFYVRFDKNLIADVSAIFNAEVVVPIVGVFRDHVYMEVQQQTSYCVLTIGNRNSVGNVRYIKYDERTEAGLEGTVVEIRDKADNLIASMTTNSKGEAFSADLRIGSYYLKELRSTEGFLLEKEVFPFEIKGNGEIIQITSSAKMNVALITFKCIDKSTLGPVGGSIFEVLNSNNESVTKIGFMDSGICSNIKLDPGVYTLRELISNTAYEFTTSRIEFTADIGEQYTVTIEKRPALAYTKITVYSEAGQKMKDTWVELFLATGSQLLELKTDANGMISISLPAGSYQARVKGTSLRPPSKLESFQVYDIAENTIVTMTLLQYDAYITGRVFGTNEEPIASVAIVAVDDMGEEFAVATTNFEGKFQLTGVPDRAVLHLIVYKAPYGFSGYVLDDRVIIIGKETTKDLVLLTMEEYNEILPEEVLRYDFYKLKGALAENSNPSTAPSNPFGNWPNLQGELPTISPSTQEIPTADPTAVELPTSDSGIPEFTTSSELSLSNDFPVEDFSTGTESTTKPLVSRPPLENQTEPELTTESIDETTEEIDNTFLLLCIIGGLALLLVFFVIYSRIKQNKQKKTREGDDE